MDLGDARAGQLWQDVTSRPGAAVRERISGPVAGRLPGRGRCEGARAAACAGRARGLLTPSQSARSPAALRATAGTPSGSRQISVPA